MKRIGIIAALDMEARCLGRLGKYPGIAVAISGPGPIRAHAAAARLAGAGVSGLVSWGMAAGLRQDLAPGQIVLATRVIDSGGRCLTCSKSWRAQVEAILVDNPPIMAGDVVQVDVPLLYASEKIALGRSSNALAADMESGAIGRVARDHRIDFLAIRAVVDTADDEIPAAAVAGMSGSGIAVHRVLTTLLRSPGQLPALLRLARNSGKARAALREVAGVIADLE
ncbi:MAG: hypothetical protein ACNA7J_02335 [Wenzhouxiangella sp.]